MATKTNALLIATHNAHKTSEFRQIFGAIYEVQDLASYPHFPAVEETGSTFEENSRLKAIGISHLLPDSLILADDSGLEVDSLNGAPGVYSARFSGPGATDASNRTLLLEKLREAGIPGSQRTARFRCVLTLASQGVILAQTSGSVEGLIADGEKGERGFGYDPIFVPQGYHQTFAELPSEVKHQLSHRGRAVEAMKVIMLERDLL